MPGLFQSNEEFRITHLIVIKQKGETDSFKDLSDEDELWELQEKYNIVQLGWIHVSAQLYIRCGTLVLQVVN